MENHHFLINTQTGLCENMIVWDGDTTKWNPPEGYITKQITEVQSRVWEFDKTANDHILTANTGDPIGIGSTWDGTHLIPPKPQLVAANSQPQTTLTSI